MTAPEFVGAQGGLPVLPASIFRIVSPRNLAIGRERPNLTSSSLNLNLCKLRIRLQLFGFFAALVLLAASGAVLRRQMFAAVPKAHTVTLGSVRKVPYTQPDATPDTK